MSEPPALEGTVLLYHWYDIPLPVAVTDKELVDAPTQ
jgi:hypothetical protein